MQRCIRTALKTNPHVRIPTTHCLWSAGPEKISLLFRHNIQKTRKKRCCARCQCARIYSRSVFYS